jgi:NADH dehydrogenase [ubiquinone] 1 alpha subcomplex assembly factor 1
MSGVDEPSRAPKTLCTFNSRASLQHYAKGCDADIGGTSTVNFTLDESEPTPTAKFWGEMRLGVRPELKGRVFGGYAGFRTSVSHATRRVFASQSSCCCRVVSDDDVR